MAYFNVRIGFGAQTLDCIDSKVFMTRFESPTSIKRGDYLMFRVTKMGYTFDGHLGVKMVGAVAGDTIKVADGTLYINGDPFGKLDIADMAAKQLNVPVSSFNRQQVIPEGYVFMVGTRPHTYDSRYWGPIPVSDVVGSMFPIF